MESGKMGDPLERYPAYVKARALYDRVVEDTERMMKDWRGRTIAAQMVRAAGSIGAKFEEGYGRATTPEFIHRLRIALGEARETAGWYRRSARFLPNDLIQKRLRESIEVIALLTATLAGLERRLKAAKEERREK